MQDPRVAARTDSKGGPGLNYILYDILWYYMRCGGKRQNDITSTERHIIKKPIKTLYRSTTPDLFIHSKPFGLSSTSLSGLMGWGWWAMRPCGIWPSSHRTGWSKLYKDSPKEKLLFAHAIRRRPESLSNWLNCCRRTSSWKALPIQWIGSRTAALFVPRQRSAVTKGESFTFAFDIESYNLQEFAGASRALNFNLGLEHSAGTDTPF